MLLESPTGKKVSAMRDDETVFSPPASDERLAGLSPPTKGKLLKLTAEEFLKYFKSDGSAVVENRTPLAFKNDRNRRKRDSKETVGTECLEKPVCESDLGFDIYYNTEEQEAIEAVSDRFKSRLHRNDTCSTCITRQSNNPRVIKIHTSPGRCRRGPVKRKAEGENVNKRIVAVDTNIPNPHKNAAKSQVSIKAKLKVAAKTLTPAEQEKRDTRSQRHKKKLEEVVKVTLKDFGIQKTDQLFKPSAMRLFNMTKDLVKDLRSYQSLRLEMERISQSNVKMVVDFERARLEKTEEEEGAS